MAKHRQMSDEELLMRFSAKELEAAVKRAKSAELERTANERFAQKQALEKYCQWKFKLPLHTIYLARNPDKPAAGNGNGGAAKPPMYLNPKTGKSWNGRGRKPKWLIGKEGLYLTRA